MGPGIEALHSSTVSDTLISDSSHVAFQREEKREKQISELSKADWVIPVPYTRYIMAQGRWVVEQALSSFLGPELLAAFICPRIPQILPQLEHKQPLLLIPSRYTLALTTLLLQAH